MTIQIKLFYGCPLGIHHLTDFFFFGGGGGVEEEGGGVGQFF